MFTFNGRDAHRNLTALRLHLPTKAAVAEILPEREKTDDDEADPALQRLPAPGLRGTWARAYGLLTRLVSQIGWDELLKTRSAVFVMEEEYRMQKAQADIAAVVHDDADTDADDDASTKGVHAPLSASQIDSPTSSASQSPTLEFTNEAAENTIPTIRISTESAREETLRAQKAAAATVNGVENINGGDPIPDGLQQPVQAAAGEGNGENKDASPGGQESFSFSNKRLCERWLDNLFMVLYEVSPRCAGFVSAPTPCARTYESGRFSARKSRTSKRSTWHTARRVWNGRFSATSVCGFIIRRRRRKLSSGRWTLPGTRSNHGQSWWTCTRKKAT
jgi:hypothetical protein